MQPFEKIKNNRLNDGFPPQLSQEYLKSNKSKSLAKRQLQVSASTSKQRIKQSQDNQKQYQQYKLFKIEFKGKNTKSTKAEQAASDHQGTRKKKHSNKVEKPLKREDKYLKQIQWLDKSYKEIYRYQLPKINDSHVSPIKHRQFNFSPLRLEKRQTFENLIDEQLIMEQQIFLEQRGSVTLQFQPKKTIITTKLEPIAKDHVFATVTKTRAGTNGQQGKINQDIAIVSSKLPFGVKLYGICDGHGLNGHMVSAFIKLHLLKNLTSSLKKLSIAPELQKMLQMLYFCLNKTNQQLLDSDINTELSGSTVVVVLIYHNRILSFNIGDSRALLIRQMATGIDMELKKLEKQGQHKKLKPKQKQRQKENKKEIIRMMKLIETHNEPKGKYQWVIKELSLDQKPQRKDECERIIKNGGRVYAQTNEQGEQLGPLRVWMKDFDMPGLAMTRSFGDKAGIKAGTNAEPEVIEHQITTEDKFIIIASDGVWQYMQNQEVVKAVAAHYMKGDLVTGGDVLMKHACDAWQRCSFSRDDITFVIVNLGEPSK